MSNRLTACQNICEDFSWLGPVTDWMANLAIVVGVFVAWRQLDSWRSERKGRRQAEVAEDTISVVFKVQDAFDDIRNPFSSIPKDRVGDKTYSYQERYDRITKYNDTFRHLREQQNLCRVLIADHDVQASINSLFRSRARVATAIEILADFIDELGIVSDEDREENRKLRRDLYARGNDTDEVGTIIAESVNMIVEKLTPLALLEGKK